MRPQRTYKGLSLLRGNYRNNKLLSFASECPACLWCGKHNDGSVVACHSNQLKDGKGKGIKAHDYRVAYLCHACHYAIDQGKDMDKTERREMWDEAHRRTIAWLFETGRVDVAKG
jgi:hypothetical protein